MEPFFYALGNGCSVGLDVGVGPQVECAAHRIAILFPE
jgi:hypothetical protein